MTERTPADVPDSSEQLDQLQPDESLSHRDRGLEDALDEGYSTPERWSAAERFGNTAAEQAAGETLDQRLAQEEPDAWDVDEGEHLDDGEVGTTRAGRLVDPNQGIGDDLDSEMIGSDVGIDGAGASAEEAAVHIVDDEAE